MDVSIQRTLNHKVYGIVYYFVSNGIVNHNSMNTVSSDIDFVITWVDGDDPDWQVLYRQYTALEGKPYDKSGSRYRDWGLLRYWFRSVELYAPWVRTIHFVTCGQCPKWLNTNHPKLNFVKHQDYIPEQYLPTFNSNPIELNIHRIKGLSEHFVLFNDDVFVVSPVKPSDFFIKGIPRDVAIRNIPMLYQIGHINLNNINIINREFDFNKQFKKNIWKWLNYRYGIHSLRSLFFLPFTEFTGVKNCHVANAFLKSSFEIVWNKYGEELDKTCLNRFRSISDVNQWLFKYWQIVSGSFYPQWINYGITYGINHTSRLQEDLATHRRKLLCLQDDEGLSDISGLKEEVLTIFQQRFPEMSSFEL